jgi:hypothetical protein
MSQVKDAFKAAVGALIADGSVKVRLSHAFEEHLEPLAELELPAGIEEAYRELAGAMHRVRPIGRQSCIHATVQKMSSAEAVAYATAIVSLYCELVEQPERSGPLKVVERAVGAAPRYLTKNP